jgi:hypothetical protein
LKGPNRFSSARRSRVLAAVAALAMAAPVLAQGGPPPPGGQPDISVAMTGVPRATEYSDLAKLPDLTGIWYPDWGALFGGRAKGPHLTPAAQAKLDAWNARYKETGPPLYAQAHCLPPGMPGMM